MGKFKVPSLRNVELTYPYMHDGRFETLENVLNHYSTGIKQSATLDLSLSNGIALSNVEKSKLIAFLKTLTDREFIKDERFKE
jgi:cytochrome c peroxidase